MARKFSPTPITCIIDKNVELSFSIRNLSDERYARVVLITPVSNFGQYNEPRNYGVEFIVKF